MPPCARICQLDGKETAQIRYLGFLTYEEMSFRKLFLERSSPLRCRPFVQRRSHVPQNLQADPRGQD